ncbi:MAG: hypothetical protein GX922_04305 [Firmicutes bacterium]|nr:hypothetical protein [Bacillota bacterium]
MQKRENGFLLLELLVTLALLAILLPPLLNVILTGTQILATAREQTIAVYLAREALEQLRSNSAELWEGQAEEVEGFAGFRRQVEITTLKVGEAVQPLRQVLVRVSWEEGEKELTLVTWQSGGEPVGRRDLH